MAGSKPRVHPEGNRRGQRATPNDWEPNVKSAIARIVLVIAVTLAATGAIVILEWKQPAPPTDQAQLSVLEKAGTRWKPAYVTVYAGGEKPRPGERASQRWRKRIPDPIVRPATAPAHDAGLQPDEKVIGIELGGESRAYRFSAFEPLDAHLVNDVVAGVPVSVAYCDITGCLRVYTDSRASQPLDLSVAGTLDDQMIIQHAGAMFFHDSGHSVEPGGNAPAIPYTLISPTVTTWQEWSKKHPDTRVYLGKPVDPRLPKQTQTAPSGK
jgi:hypothetical protein